MKKPFTRTIAASSFCMLLVIGGVLLWRANQTEPLTSQPISIPTIAQSSPSDAGVHAESNTTNESSATTTNTATAEDPTPTPRAAAPKEDTRPSTVPSSPAQTAIRQSTKTENVYYPLLTPNDPGYPLSNWALTQIKAPAAWDTATGDNSTIVAVLDTGFALNHDDLSGAWHTNSGEIGTTTLGDNCWTGISLDKSTNNCDDDSNGYVDDWRGWDFYNGTNNAMAGQDDTEGIAVTHGTETAGLVGAVGNNNTGIATLNWRTKLMPLKVLSDEGPGYTSDIVAAIRYAVDNGATVINLSLGGNEPDSSLVAATDYAYENNVVVVAAAGNCGTGTGDGCTGYPAGIIGYPAKNPHVISVGASDSSMARASFSSYGDALDVMAPGSGSIYTPTWTSYDDTSLYATAVYGTSFAAPFVSSLASLIQSVRPGASVEDITALILGTAQKTGISNGIYSTTLGHGVIDASKAIAVATALNSAEDVPVLYQTGNEKSEHAYSASASMASGCESSISSSYCTVIFENMNNGYERVLPYKTLSGTYTHWSWNTDLLANDWWSVRAVQGNGHSAGYMLAKK